MPRDESAGSRVRRGPLTDYERALIHAAETQVWTWALAATLRATVEARGIPTSPYETPGSLVDVLREVAQ
jgi:hypothetical protein